MATSSQPPCSPHGWTVDTLETHLTKSIDTLRDKVIEYDDRNKERFQSMKENVAAALAAADKATSKAESASNTRFESVNEFRQALGDQASKLLTRSEYEMAHSGLVEKVDMAITRIAAIEAGGKGKSEGAASINMVVMSIIAAVAAIVSVGSHFIK